MGAGSGCLGHVVYLVSDIGIEVSTIWDPQSWVPPFSSPSRLYHYLQQLVSEVFFVGYFASVWSDGVSEKFSLVHVVVFSIGLSGYHHKCEGYIQ